MFEKGEEDDNEEEGLSPEDIEALKREMNGSGGEEEEEVYGSLDTDRSEHTEEEGRAYADEEVHSSLDSQYSKEGDFMIPPDMTFDEEVERRPWRGYGEPPKSESEERARKIKALAKIDRLERRGDKFYHPFTMRNDLEELEEVLKDRDELNASERGKRVSKKTFVEAIKHIEKGSILFGPEWLNLYGWSQDVEDDIDTYEEPLYELWKRFKSTSFGDSPIFQILMMLALSGSTHAAFNERPRPPTYWQRKRMAIKAKQSVSEPFFPQQKVPPPPPKAKHTNLRGRGQKGTREEERIEIK